MSWDEKDWAYTWITGKRSRLNLLFRRLEIENNDDIERYTIKEYNRNVYEFGIMDKQEMIQIAQDYGIMIEHQYLGFQCHCFDFRNRKCNFDNIDFRTPPPFHKRNSPLLSIHQHNEYNSLDINKYQKDKLILEDFLIKLKKRLSNKAIDDVYLKEFENKRIIEIEKIITSLKYDIKKFHNICINPQYWFYTTIEGKLSRLNLLFRKTDKKKIEQDPEVKAIFYAENSDLNLKSKDEFQQIKEIAKTYGICIKLSYHVYDFRDIDVEYENIDIEEPTPLNYINIGKFIASVSTFDFIF